MRTIAVDWSGAVRGERSRIWLAEAAGGEALRRLEDGRGRAELIEHLVADLPRGTPAVVGFDFAFGLPAWYAGRLEARTAADVWRAVAAEGERWLATCPWPFWGRPRRRRPDDVPAHLRETERATARTRSVFQIGGAGAVGTGSLRGMPLLLELRAAGWSIWPFDPPGWPVAVEIYPRAFMRPVRHSAQGARAGYLEAYHPRLAPEQTRAAAGSEHAFDAAVAALGMARALDAGVGFPQVRDGTARLEGLIWGAER